MYVVWGLKPTALSFSFFDSYCKDRSALLYRHLRSEEDDGKGMHAGRQDLEEENRRPFGKGKSEEKSKRNSVDGLKTKSGLPGRSQTLIDHVRKICDCDSPSM